MEIPIQVLCRRKKKKKRIFKFVVNYILELKSEEEILMYR